jgi:ribonucleoside-triphosphate reductase
MYPHLCYKFSDDKKKYLESQVQDKPKRSDLANFVNSRTYSRIMYDNKGNPVCKEDLEDIVIRVVCGAFSLLKNHLEALDKLYKVDIDNLAERMYYAIHNCRITPPGRGLWAMGTRIVNADFVGMSLVNCTFITSRNIDKVKQEFFHYVMDSLMLGVGVGFDTKGAGKLRVHKPTRGNFNRDENIYKFAEQIKEFDRNDFLDKDKISYLEHERQYINNLFTYQRNHVKVHVIKDSREGWCKAVTLLLRSYMEEGQYFIIFDYSQIRKEGELLKRFGGKASGAKPLAEAIAAIRRILETKYIGKFIDEIFIIDICNIIARTVVAGNVRRSSQICLSSNFNIVDCKQLYDKEGNPITQNYYRKPWMWASNNSFIAEAEVSDDVLRSVLERVRERGEPGLFNLYVARAYGRIIDGITNGDMNAEGVNPCGEITLEGTTELASCVPYSAGGETCNLTETMPCNYHFIFSDDIDWQLLWCALNGCKSVSREQVDSETRKLESLISLYLDDLYIANLYCKIVTLVSVNWKSTECIQNKNRRIGISITGIPELLCQMGLMTDEFAGTLYDSPEEEQSITFMRFAVFLDCCYKRICKNDIAISELLNIPVSIKKTTVKPSGTVSTTNDVCSGMHFPPSKYWIRRVRIATTEYEMINKMQDAGYHVEKVNDCPNTVAISFPMKVEHDMPEYAPIDLQFKIMLFLQRYWADNQVSCSIYFKEHEYDRLVELILKYKNEIKGLAVFPYFGDSVYECAPLEKITEERYNEIVSRITKKVNPYDQKPKEEIEYDTHCDGDKCIRVPRN